MKFFLPFLFLCFGHAKAQIATDTTFRCESCVVHHPVILWNLDIVFIEHAGYNNYYDFSIYYDPAAKCGFFEQELDYLSVHYDFFLSEPQFSDSTMAAYQLHVRLPEGLSTDSLSNYQPYTYQTFTFGEQEEETYTERLYRSIDGPFYSVLPDGETSSRIGPFSDRELPEVSSGHYKRGVPDGLCLYTRGGYTFVTTHANGVPVGKWISEVSPEYFVPSCYQVAYFNDSGAMLCYEIMQRDSNRSIEEENYTGTPGNRATTVDSWPGRGSQDEVDTYFGIRYYADGTPESQGWFKRGKRTALDENNELFTYESYVPFGYHQQWDEKGVLTQVCYDGSDILLPEH